MPTVSLLQAKADLSRLVDAVASGREREIVIVRNGRPAARLVPVEAAVTGQRIGIAKGKFVAPEPDAKLDVEVARRFRGRATP